MDSPSPAIRDLAGRLLAASQAGSESHGHDAAVVIEKLRIAVTRVAGAEGFTSLLRRALVLASRDMPSLHSVKLGAHGRLEGIEDLAAGGAGGARTRDEAAVTIAAHFLGLLITFIGEALTLNLVRDAWPEASLGK